MNWITKIIAKILYWLTGPVMRVLYPAEIIWENKQLTEACLKGNCIVFSNHNSHVDGLYFTRRLNKYHINTYVGKDWYEKKKINWLFRNLPYIPVDRKQMDTAWMLAGKEKLNALENIYIFPEGHTSAPDFFDEFKPGFLMLAKQTNASLVPIYMHDKFKVFHKVKIVIGKPVQVDLQEKGRPSIVMKKHAAFCRESVMQLSKLCN